MVPIYENDLVSGNITKIVISNVNNKAYNISIQVHPYIKFIYYNYKNMELWQDILPVFIFDNYDQTFSIFDVIAQSKSDAIVYSIAKSINYDYLYNERAVY